MPEEADFVRAIRDNPDDDAPFLLYADWLLYQGKDREAEWVKEWLAWIRKHFPYLKGKVLCPWWATEGRPVAPIVKPVLPKGLTYDNTALDTVGVASMMNRIYLEERGKPVFKQADFSRLLPHDEG